MGFLDWLMKGIGFESDEDEVLNDSKSKKDKKNKNKNREEKDVGFEPKSQNSSYNAFGSVDANNFSTKRSEENVSSYDNFSNNSANVGGFGTKNVVIHHPKTYKEVQSLIDYLKQGESAIMILDGVFDNEAQRTLDFVSGAVYALSGSIQKIEGNIYLLTPEGYNIVKSEQKKNWILNSAYFDIFCIKIILRSKNGVQNATFWL